MADSWQSKLLQRRWLWPAAVGIALGACVAAFGGHAGVWIALGLGVAMACVALFMAGNEGAAASAAPRAGHADAVLPALAPDVFEHLPDPLMLLDAVGRVIFANAAMATIIGKDFARKHVSALLRTPSLLAAVERTAATGEPTTVAFIIPVPIERYFNAFVSRTDSSPPLTALLLHDVTSAHRAERTRADFVANASHELRTPLAAVSGFIDTLKGHARDDAEARTRFLDIMSVEAGRMRRLIDDLLSLTRIELNEHVPPSGEVSLNDVMRDAAMALGPLAQGDRVSIEIAAAPDLPPVAGQRDELAQLFQNLIHNAIKYGRQGGHVWISMGTAPVQGRRGAPEMVFVSVRDDGEGIPRDAIPRLTERFYRVDVKRSRERGGTGLGLAIVKHIVNRHHGRLQIDSEAGQGSTFTVYLPVAGTPAQMADVAVTELL
jgi:two-component system phosphate regulon sensor histidine kinase PhoR